MGNAEIPAAPNMGLIFSLLKRLMSFAHMIPPMVSNTNANKPRAIMMSVSNVKKSFACIWNAMVIPRSKVMIFEKVVCAVSVSACAFYRPHARVWKVGEFVGL